MTEDTKLLLTQREQQVLDHIKNQIDTKGYPPAVREICAALDIRSTSTVHTALKNLTEKGYIVREEAKPRAMAIVKQ